MQDHDEDLSPYELDLHDKRRSTSKESEEEDESAKRREDLEEEKERGKHRRSERVKDHLSKAIIVAIWFFVGFVILAAGSLVWHYAICPHLSPVHAEVLKGALASFTILNAVLIATKTIDLG